MKHRTWGECAICDCTLYCNMYCIATKLTPTLNILLRAKRACLSLVPSELSRDSVSERRVKHLLHITTHSLPESLTNDCVHSDRELGSH